ncbi:group III truncated hemoglobin [Marinicauda algicola]|uniref:Group III truncated hemoglobin n=1 Tax=Marinicauda algicola TaxID=2029849 RepID=A0A4S2H2H2_9PROT|nr:group III truncated hemoglobin [Marinicauda algicola]TGY89800.1 group III truncated hemoglobin [Marinicauda algicola]
MGPESFKSHAAAPRAAQRAAFAHAIGIDEAMIERLVDRFYARVREDALLAPVFAAKIADWEPHLRQMYAFWSSVVLGTGRYHGRPMPKHAPLPVCGDHFDRWLALFEATAREVCPPRAAEIFIERARRIAASLEYAIALTRGADLAPGERLGEP